MEWQADFYASCLLMPRRLVMPNGRIASAGLSPCLLSDLRPNGNVMSRAETLIHEQGRDEADAVDDALFESVARANRTPLRRLAVPPCASGSKSSGCCFAQNQSSRLAEGHPVTFF